MDRSTALERLKAWCALQERSQHECRQKLRTLGLSSGESEEIIAELISENFLNEERFAKAFSGGKFRIKGWGRLKIRNALRQHRVSEYNISKGLASISESDYLKMLEKLARRKYQSIKKGPAAPVLYRFLVSRGFEPAAVHQQFKLLELELNEPRSEE